MSIPTLTNVDQWPTRKLPQSTFDTSVRTSMNQISTMVSELNSGVIPGINAASEAAVDSAAAAAADAALIASKVSEAATSATSAASSATTATTQASAASTSATNAATSATAAAGSATSAATSATNAAASAAAAAAVTGLPSPAVGDAGKAVVVKSDASGFELAAIESDANAGGSVKQSISVDLTLTVDSPRKMALTATASGLKVILPNATTLSQDGVSFVVANIGDVAISVADSTGKSVGEAVAPGAAAAFILVDTATNGWVAFDLTVKDGARTFIKPSDPTVFASQNVSNVKIIGLSDTKCVVLYNGTVGAARVLTLNGTGIDVGVERVFNNANTVYLSAAKISETVVLVAYSDGGASNYGTAQTLTISGGTVLEGAKLQFDANTTIHISCAVLSSTKALVSYVNGSQSNYCYSALLNISGANLSIATAGTLFSSGSPRSTVLARLSDTTALIAYSYNNTTEASVVTVSGNSFAYGAVNTLFTSSWSSSTAVVLSGNSVFFSAVSGTDTQNRGIAGILTVNGTSVSCTSHVFFSEMLTTYISAAKLSAAKVLVAFAEDTAFYNAKAVIFSVEGTKITPWRDYKITTLRTNYTSLAALTENTILTAYADGGNGSYGTAKVLSVC